MTIDIKLIKQLREQTSAGVADVREALEEASGDLKKAEELLRQKGFERAAKKGGRATGAGLIDAYIHQGRAGAIVEVLCETDFVARTSEFKTLTHELAMQVASMNPKDNPDLLKQEYIRDPSKTISDLIKETIAKLGENITVGRFSRFELGK
ncbi:MAG: translation elongation factor Ts [Candidatus Levybacteria bacterium RIFCSPHIGHO2_02_FULL_40_18]|nr:MAG: translation elongation factor Ts [Candidatus Levybacteria bacterium RIFCSPHIGHO2_01_FULL_40_58]OGH26681.1 MAG: translation elongation factor Ts [Candidatus Levybacteria bacterium RIFCSPHIGHO2_02_FULL_40_18]OGH31616.1 MAG: translation elongation factor Ts [Candidatus Levybacteria bacterium RIFCSPHIGHO2_12_FULL_40_31]OGH40244.1 MAG: translation elongation factor Ts [Candidatus Levybacteria bacterium RIFCSPLOWO2_01_FULL_40_64]OGH49484.1 MAG: translation elongation factor Ts [Candidatus Lev